MNENKKIEKLSETGEQSAEKVVGGTITFDETILEHFELHHKPLKPPRREDRTIPRSLLEPFKWKDRTLSLYSPAAPLDVGKCDDCGITWYTRWDQTPPLIDGNLYCFSCYAKHTAAAAEPTPSVDAGLKN